MFRKLKTYFVGSKQDSVGLVYLLYIIVLVSYGQVSASEEYLIITREMFLDALSPFVTAREADGLNVYVTTLSEIRRTYTGVDIQEQIRNCIIARYRGHNTVWVLLVGCPDADDNPAATANLNKTIIDKPWEVPVRYVYAPTDDYFYVPAEAYYSCLDGTWDADGDGMFYIYLFEVKIKETRNDR